MLDERGPRERDGLREPWLRDDDVENRIDHGAVSAAPRSQYAQSIRAQYDNSINPQARLYRRGASSYLLCRLGARATSLNVHVRRFDLR